MKLYVVRLYDGFDNLWIDVTDPVPLAKAEEIWNQKTNNGTRARNYSDIDYYKICEADTKMLIS